MLALRLFYLQVIRAPQFRLLAEQQTLRRITLPAKRGTIYDRNLVKLAVTIDSYDIAARPKAIPDVRVAAKKLAQILDKDPDDLLAELRAHASYFYLIRQIDAEMGVRIKKARIPGIDSIPITRREYPNGKLASQILGFVGSDGRGQEGVERSLDRILRGQDGYVIAEKDARGVIIPGTVKARVEPDDGKDVVLTIDSVIQHTVEKELAQQVKDREAAGGSALVLDPKTGAILALANMPDFDPNKKGSNMDAWRNRAVKDLYEPGSTLKTMTACAALQDGVVSTTDTFHCAGSMRIGRRTVRCSLHGKQFAHGHGTVDIAKILRYSCNIGAAGLGFKLGKQKLHDYDKAFGLYERPGSELPGETPGFRDDWENWAQIHLANVAFGQGIAVTPLQMAKAYVAVANGGKLMRPYIVKETRTSDGKIDHITSPKVIRQVMSAEAAGEVSQMLYGAVSEKHGTGEPAKVEGYKVGGKTGSAQKASTTGRGYAAGKFVASFAGFLPISDPRAVVLVTVDEPKGTHWGATVAAPVFQKVAQKIMWYLRVSPDDGKPKGDDKESQSKPKHRHHREPSDDAASSPTRVRMGG